MTAAGTLDRHPRPDPIGTALALGEGQAVHINATSIRRNTMELVKWNPFRELEHMQRRVNRLFGDPTFEREVENGMSFSGWSPAVDVQETEKEFLIKADLPDVKKEDVKVELLDGTLTIEGERQQEKEEKGKTFHKVEREYGRFKNGVLHVHLPKSATSKPKAVEVKVS
jgi:HSP20 family protein